MQGCFTPVRVTISGTLRYPWQMHVGDTWSGASVAANGWAVFECGPTIVFERPFEDGFRVRARAVATMPPGTSPMQQFKFVARKEQHTRLPILTLGEARLKGRVAATTNGLRAWAAIRTELERDLSVHLLMFWPF